MRISATTAVIESRALHESFIGKVGRGPLDDTRVALMRTTSAATNLPSLQSGNTNDYEIRTVQELLGHKDVRTMRNLRMCSTAEG